MFIDPDLPVTYAVMLGARIALSIFQKHGYICTDDRVTAYANSEAGAALSWLSLKGYRINERDELTRLGNRDGA